MREIKKFKKVLVANRGEIAIRIFRACNELGIRSVGIYSEEDKNALFRQKADESYLVGKGKAPVAAYLGIDEIIELAKAKGVDAIHPGYGFLSENVEFAKACSDSGIEFIGPTHHMMEKLGDKIQSKIVAAEVGVPTIPGVETAIETEQEALEIARKTGYPIILKAAAGGGGRGMRIVESEDDLVMQYNSAKSEALKAFGIGDVFIEKYLRNPKHIEVQVLGDKSGNVVHLYERDCSIQRRHQKVVEFCPALCIDDKKRNEMCSDALAIARSVDYRSAGTVEFLLAETGEHYFIEMNPRIQVEHTVTEMITGIDIVQSQILIAQGYDLSSDEIGITKQEDISIRGYSIQSRITTEDPVNGFAPDNGVIDKYISASGYGIRLDGGNGFNGAEITPYYDSLLVKLTSWGLTFEAARRKAIRALRETKIKGVKTNIGFLLNVMNHPIFIEGKCDTGFIQKNPELLNIARGENLEIKVLDFLGNKIVNETKGVKPMFDIPQYPTFKDKDCLKLEGTKQILDSKGPKAVADYALAEKRLLMTDTTMRDAQQSLLATRMRTVDMEKIAPAISVYGQKLFSIEMWGGATFDTSYRFLKESPWERLEVLRASMPNILMQMLIRGANAVGYKNYPDNVISKFIKEASSAGIDVFRIFDSLNWIKGMEVALDETLKQDKVAEACICYTGDILDEKRDKYSLQYYLNMAKELEKRGTHILGIKDMAGLVKPQAAYKLVKALKNEISIPIHFHTHDTSGNGVAAVLMAAEAGVDIADGAFNSMAGLTSQPALNSIVAALQKTERDTGIIVDEIQEISNYFQAVRPIYCNFESELKTPSADIYHLEIPGGQYSNLKPQVESFGIGHKFEEVKAMYVVVNKIMGDIVKVTPSSKMVGDMAIFMVQNELDENNIYEKAKDIDFPDSVVSYFEGMMGQPEGGFPKKLQEVVLKGKKPITVRPGELLEDEDFDAIRKHLIDDLKIEATEQEIISYALYPKVFEEYVTSLSKEGNLRYMGSDTFFHSIALGETCDVKVKEGKEYIVKLSEIRDLDEEGYREIVFESNGNRRIRRVKDNTITFAGTGTTTLYAEEDNPYEIGANIPGNIIKILVNEGESVAEKQPIAVIEAMKMETNIISTVGGVIDKLYVKEGQQVKASELIAKIK